MSNNPIVYPLFAAPVYWQPNTGIQVSDAVLQQLINLPRLSDACGLSHDVDVLDRPDLAHVRALCEYHLQQYVTQVCGFGNEIYITTSWLSRNYTGVDHPAHSHPDSLYSGCIYLRSSPDNRLSFHGINHFSDHFPFCYDITHQNLYNSNEWWVPVDTGTLVIWPSNIPHSASANQLSDVRVALCFNSFIRGTLGKPGDYAGRLHLK